MKKEPTVQVNMRLPVSLVEGIKEVLQHMDEETQTSFIRKNLRQQVARKKRQIESKRMALSA